MRTNSKNIKNKRFLYVSSSTVGTLLSKETMVGVGYSGQVDAAAVGPVKILAPTIGIDPDDFAVGPLVRMQGHDNKWTRKKGISAISGRLLPSARHHRKHYRSI